MRVNWIPLGAATQTVLLLRNMLPADSKSYLVPSQNAIILHSTRTSFSLAPSIPSSSSDSTSNPAALK